MTTDEPPQWDYCGSFKKTVTRTSAISRQLYWQKRISAIQAVMVNELENPKIIYKVNEMLVSLQKDMRGSI